MLKASFWIIRVLLSVIVASSSLTVNMWKQKGAPTTEWVVNKPEFNLAIWTTSAQGKKKTKKERKKSLNVYNLSNLEQEASKILRPITISSSCSTERDSNIIYMQIQINVPENICGCLVTSIFRLLGYVPFRPLIYIKIICEKLLLRLTICLYHIHILIVWSPDTESCIPFSCTERRCKLHTEQVWASILALRWAY